MDRRTKIILLSIGSALLLAAMFWFVIWPLLKPVLPQANKPQPPELTEPNAPNPQTAGTSQQPTSTAPTFIYNPGDHPDAEKIAELSRRAGVFSERAESGSSENGFENILLSAQDASPRLADQLKASRTAMQKQYPAEGPVYLTIARRLVEIPESKDVISRDTFNVRVQMQVQIREGGKTTVEYREATVVFTNVNGEWLLSGYSVKPYTP
jgi:hypothetical protein